MSFVETRAAAPAKRAPDGPAWPIVARLEDATDRYSHDVLGDLPHFASLSVIALACGSCAHGSEGLHAALPEDMVFEDTAPRLWDVTGDGRPEIVVVESHVARGARLTVWSYKGVEAGGTLTRVGATDFIGQPNRWLAPAGFGDFDGDGRIEIAYVDRPHLVRELVYVRLQGDRLVEVARLPGVTNHRIGDEVISGGARDCGQGAELVLASKDWSRLLVIGWSGGPTTQEAGPWSAAAMRAALACR